MPRNYSCLECTYEYTQWMGQRCPSDNDTVITVNNIITYCLVKTEYDVTSSIIALIMCMYVFTVVLVPEVDQTGET